MFSPTRIVATVLVFVMMIASLVAALYVRLFYNSYLFSISLKCCVFSLIFLGSQWIVNVIYDTSVACYDMVFSLLYSIRKGCCEENIRSLHSLVTKLSIKEVLCICSVIVSIWCTFYSQAPVLIIQRMKFYGVYYIISVIYYRNKWTIFIFGDW